MYYTQMVAFNPGAIKWFINNRTENPTVTVNNMAVVNGQRFYAVEIKTEKALDL